MSEFIGRRRELEALENAYQSSRSCLIPIYGRRRVGKSELILHFMKDKPGVYFLGKKAPAGLQIREFLEEAALALQEPLLANQAANRWKDALTAVSRSQNSDRKLILVFDEVQWTASSSPELLSELQEMWDRQWQDSGRIFLILCGSLVGFMEKEVLGRRSPLFGRRTAQILLQPFGFREAAEFHPGYSLPDKAKAYFICGGIPLYLKFFSDKESIPINIFSQLLQEHAPLFREPDFLLREELREVEKYYAVLLAVATGNSSAQSISKVSGIESRSLHYYLQQLVALRYVQRRYPLTGKRPAARSVRFSLEDPLLKFWFRFIYPNTSYLPYMGPELALQHRILPGLESYFGLCFERLCREALPYLYRREGVTPPFEIGEYWSRDAQIDVVGLREDGWTDLGECKWGQVRSAVKLERQLEARVRSYPNPRNATIGRRIFVQGKIPRRTSKDYRWHGLEDLYRE